MEERTLKDKKPQKRLLFCSGVLLLCSTLGFGLVPVIDKVSIRKGAQGSRLNSLQSDIRNSLDRATLQWELARVFLNHEEMLKKLNADPEVVARNSEHYRYNISNADTYARNAAQGFQDSKGITQSTKVLVLRPKRSIEEIRASFPSNVIEATKRSNRVIADRNRLEDQAKRWGFTKTILHMASLIINCIKI